MLLPVDEKNLAGMSGNCHEQTFSVRSIQVLGKSNMKKTARKGGFGFLDPAIAV